MYINFVFFCISNLGKIIQIVSHHESDSDQSIESGQPEKEKGHKEQAQEQSSTESGRAVQPEKERGHKEIQPEKDLDQEYLYVGDNCNDDSISVNTLTIEMEVQELIDRVTTLEQGYTAVLNQQRYILQNQERILSRLAILERQQATACMLLLNHIRI